MSDEKVVVTLEARTRTYIKRLEESKLAYERHTQSAIKNSKDAQRFLEKSQKGQVKSTQRTQKSIERAVKSQTKSIERSTGLQAQFTEETTVRITAALRRQMAARDQNVDSAEKSSSRVKSAFGALANFGLASTIFDTVKGSLEAASEIKLLADSAGLTTERFTESTFAAQRYGIEQEKLADIFRDVSGSVEQLLFKGAGPLQDFLDRAGTKAGLTADSFIGLGSDEVLGLVAKTMEEAGQGGQLLTNTLESLSSDAANLKPLLADNAKELKALAVEARATGQVLNDDAASAAFNANVELDRLGTTLKTGIRNAIVEAAPEIEALTKKIVELLPTLIEWAGVAADIFTKLGIAIDDVSAKDVKVDTKDSQAQIRKLNREWEKLGKAKQDGTLLLDKLEAQLEKTNSAKKADRLKKRIAEQKEENQLLLEQNARKKAEIEWIKAGRIIKGQVFGEAQKQAAAEEERSAAAIKDAEKHAKKEAEIAAIKDARDAVAEANAKRIAAQQAKITEARIAREVMAIEALGRSEEEQINMVLAARLDAIAKSKTSETEKQALERTARDVAQKDLDALAKRQSELAAKSQAEIRQREESEFQAKQDRLGFIAEIEATAARMNGRALQATQIELAALRRRYTEELAYIDALIEKKGETPELLSQRAEAQAKIASVDEDKDNLRKSIEDVSETTLLDPVDQDSGLSGQLEQLQAERDAKLKLLEDFKTEDVELERARQEEVLEIMSEYEDKKNQIILESHLKRFDQAAKFASQISSVIKAAGLEGTKAAKIAAKAEQGIALGKAVVNGALAVTEAAASAPFPANIPAIAFAVATNAAQIATIASQTFKDGGVNILGPGTGTSDSIPARISRGESVITAAATRGNETGLLGLNNGLSPAQAFGLPSIKIPMPNLSVPSISSSSGNRNFRSGDVIVQGNVDRETMPQFLAALADRDRKFSSNVNRIIDARERRTISRRERVLGR